MNSAAIRQQLHRYIDTGDDRKLEALYILLKSDIPAYTYTEEELNQSNERADRYAKGQGKTSPEKGSNDLI